MPTHYAQILRRHAVKQLYIGGLATYLGNALAAVFGYLCDLPSADIIAVQL